MAQGTDILTRDQILKQALSLPAEDRAYLADMLEGSLPEPPPPSEQWAANWAREVERRVAAYDRGEVKTMSFEESIEHVRRALDENRSRSGQQ